MNVQKTDKASIAKGGDNGVVVAVADRVDSGGRAVCRRAALVDLACVRVCQFFDLLVYCVA